jgi:hypothetical protein
MRLILAAGAAAAVVAAGMAASPASAAGSVDPVSGVIVTPSTDNDGTGNINVSWSSEPSDADGALICLHRGKTAIQTPSSCESQVPVETPGLSSGLITIHPGKNYVIEVFAYKSTSPVIYSTPVTRVRHGIKVAMGSHCNGQSVGDTCSIVGTVTDAYTGSHLGNRKIELWQSRVHQPAKWTMVARRSTASTGVAHANVVLDKTRLYQWYYAVPHAHEMPSNSSRVEIVVS